MEDEVWPGEQKGEGSHLRQMGQLRQRPEVCSSWGLLLPGGLIVPKSGPEALQNSSAVIRIRILLSRQSVTTEGV